MTLLLSHADIGAHPGRVTSTTSPPPTGTAMPRRRPRRAQQRPLLVVRVSELTRDDPVAVEGIQLRSGLQRPVTVPGTV